MKRTLIAAGAAIAVAVFAVFAVVGWSVGRSAGATDAPKGGQVAVAATSAKALHYYLSINTPDMLGGTEDTGPAYVPSNFTLPANADVTLTITNFDGATALPAEFAKASGIKGAMTIETIDTVHPNAPGTVTTATSLDPTQGVSHTFTISTLGINVPIAPQSRVTFTFHTPKAGVYDWRCMDPCGNGPAGWGAAMSAKGFMEGSVTFA